MGDERAGSGRGRSPRRGAGARSPGPDDALRPVEVLSDVSLALAARRGPCRHRRERRRQVDPDEDPVRPSRADARRRGDRRRAAASVGPGRGRAARRGAGPSGDPAGARPVGRAQHLHGPRDHGAGWLVDDRAMDRAAAEAVRALGVDLDPRRPVARAVDRAASGRADRPGARRRAPRRDLRRAHRVAEPGRGRPLLATIGALAAARRGGRSTSRTGSPR